MSTASIRVRVHEPGDRRLDGILRLIEEAGRARPLADVLATLCREIGGIARAPVVSVYVLEGDELVMRGNVGFPDGIVGQAKLRVGEGLTGFAAECLRPISVAVARHDERFKQIPGLDEDMFPSYLGIPLLGGEGCAGVLVLQRREARELPPAEVALAAALAAPVAYALERARGREAERAAERQGAGRAASTSRAVRLDGRPLAPGSALGRADVLPALAGLEGAPPRGDTRPGHAVALALAGISRELLRSRKAIEARGALEPDTLIRLRAMSLLLDDLRFRDLVVAECSAQGVARGLASVAREYARAPFRVGSDAGFWLRERAPEVEDLCLLVAARATGHQLSTGGAVLVTERLSGIMALAAAARHAVAVVIAGPAEESAFGAAIARAAGLPVVAAVAGLYAWARPEDRILVDGDEGVVRINPPATAVARLRARDA
jgi:phosphotransferase system, enzyme I, PtsP